MSDQYGAAKVFLSEVRSSFSRKISEANTFLVLGNHDIQRSRVANDQTEWLDHQKSVDEIIELMSSGNRQWSR